MKEEKEAGKRECSLLASPVILSFEEKTGRLPAKFRSVLSPTLISSVGKEDTQAVYVCVT